MKVMTLAEVRETKAKAENFYNKQKDNYEKTGLKQYLEDCELAKNVISKMDGLIDDFYRKGVK